MAYIWDDYSVNNLFRITSDGVSPYLEVWNQNNGIVPVNIFYRLHTFLLPKDILNTEEKLKQQLSLYEEDARYKDIGNSLIHFLAQLDRIKGMSLMEIVERIQHTNILCGIYGETVKEQFESLKQRDQEIFLRYMAKYDLGLQRETVFDAVLYAIFETVRLYYENSDNMLRIYIGEKHNDYNITCYALCEYFFKDFNVKTSVYWQGEHFGIIGFEETMQVDHIALI